MVKAKIDSSSIFKKSIELYLHTKEEHVPFYKLANARKVGEIILQNEALMNTYIELPIFKPVVEWLKKDKIRFKKIIFVSTNQNESVQERFRRNDTFHYARILEQWIKRQTIESKDKQKKLYDEIEHIEIENSPFDYEQMWNFFQQKLKKHVKPKDEVYMLLQTGIDAVNFGILNEIYNITTNFIYLAKPDSSNLVSPIPLAQKYVKSSNQKLMNKLMEHYLFDAVKDADFNEKTNLLSEYVIECFHFRFKEATAVLQKLIVTDQENKQFYRKLEQEQENSKTKEKICYLSAKIRLLKQNNTTDFLNRIFTLSENMLKNEVTAITGINFSKQMNDSKSEWEKKMKEYPVKNGKKVQDFLKEYKINDKNLLNTEKINRYVLLALLEFENQFGENPGKYTSLIQLSKAIQPLAELRNDVTHNLQSVTMEEINENAPENDILALFKQADAYYGIENFWIFSEIETKLKEMV